MSTDIQKDNQPLQAANKAIFQLFDLAKGALNWARKSKLPKQVLATTLAFLAASAAVGGSALSPHSSAHPSDDPHGNLFAADETGNIYPTFTMVQFPSGPVKVWWTYPTDANGKILQPETIHNIIVPASLTLGRNVTWSQTAKFGENVTVEDNSYIGPGVILENKSYVGRNSTVQKGSHIGPDTYIDDNVTVGPDVEFGPENYVERNATIGQGSKFGTLNRVDHDATVGAYAHLEDDNNIGHNVVVGSGLKAGSFNNIPSMQPLFKSSNVTVGKNVTLGDFNQLEMNVSLAPHDDFGSYNYFRENASFGSYRVYGSDNVFAARYHGDAEERIYSALAYGLSSQSRNRALNAVLKSRKHDAHAGPK
jgi:carbonic anhydrase/acetyltransferase-like protein (isoleucine patch superfamily)